MTLHRMAFGVWLRQPLEYLPGSCGKLGGRHLATNFDCRGLVMLSNRWSILALLFAVRMGMGLQYQAVAALSPLYMADFSISIADIGLLIGLNHAPGTVLAFPGGAIGARLGDKRVVLIGLALMISGELMTALAPWSMRIRRQAVGRPRRHPAERVDVEDCSRLVCRKELDTAMAIFGNSAPCGIPSSAAPSIGYSKALGLASSTRYLPPAWSMGSGMPAWSARNWRRVGRQIRGRWTRGILLAAVMSKLWVSSQRLCLNRRCGRLFARRQS
jgi:MFS family permease